MKRTLLLSVAIALAACAGPADDPAQEGTSADATSEEAAPPASAGNDAPAPEPVEVVTIVPLATENCRPGAYTADVNWTIPAGQPGTEIEVRLNSVDGRLLAYKKARKGTARTGNWVKPGMQFFLVDRQTKAAIAEATAGDHDCR